jgi:galactonate dehydratase
MTRLLSAILLVPGTSIGWSKNHDLDFVRRSLPNVGGITEMTRICALCETHDIGIVPHFTGPIATAA